VLANVVDVRVNQHEARHAPTHASQVLDALGSTGTTRRRTQTLLRHAPPLWLMSAPPSMLAGDLALCHPKLVSKEVRAVVRPIEGTRSVRLTVAAPDRRGLLADKTDVVGRHGLWITDASAATWPRHNLALHALTIADASEIESGLWELVGNDLREIGRDHVPRPCAFAPVGHAVVSSDGRPPGQTLVRVSAPDQSGLLSAICNWFADHDVSVESLHATTDGERVHDVFLVSGAVAPAELAQYLSRG